MSLPIVHHPDYRLSLTRTGSNDLSKYSAIMDAIIDAALVSDQAWHEPEPASIDDLRAAHTAAWIEKVIDGTLSDEEQKRIGLVGNEILPRRVRISVGGTILTARLALEHGIALNTAGGSHHAHRDFGSGYCVFNDVAVAAGVMLREMRVKQVLVLDLDVHQGDGTATIFYGEDQVFTFSMHCQKNFPHRKSVSDLDIALPAGMDDEGYLYLLGRQIDRLFETVRPDLVFYNAGVDVHVNDKLGGLALGDKGLFSRDSEVMAAARRHGVPIAVVPGGGYGDDMTEVAKRHLVTFQAAAATFPFENEGNVASAP